MDSPPVIRPYRADDRQAIVELLAASEPWRTLGYTADEWNRRLAGIVADRAREVDVVEHEGAAAGIAIVRLGFLLGDYLELFAIGPAVRQRGFGRALLAHLEQRVLSRATNFFLCVSDFNAPAREFYRRQGYQEIGALDDLLIAGRAEILMRKTTGPARSRGNP